MNYQDKIENILKSYDFSQRFYVKYAVACAKIAMADWQNPDERSLAGIAMAERFANGENVSQEERKAVASYASYASYAAAAASAAAASASYANRDSRRKQLYELLLDLIQTEFSELERILLGIAA